MAKLSTDELLDAFKELTLLELSEFVKKFEETFEVTAAAPAAAVVAAAPAGEAAAEVEEKGREIYEMFLRVASGEMSKSEAQGLGDATRFPLHPERKPTAKPGAGTEGVDDPDIDDDRTFLPKL